MSTLTTRLGIKKPADTDPFLTSDFDSNYDTIDSYPGVWVCTSTTLPSWTSAQAGQLVLCEDTHTVLLWTGTSFVDPLAVPPAWDLYTSLNTSVSAQAAPTSDASPTIATFTIGTFTSTRAGTGMFAYQTEYLPENVARGFRVIMNLSVNGTQVSGAAYDSQAAIIPFNAATNYTNVFFASGRKEFGSFGTAPVLKGTNTVTATYNYAAFTDNFNTGTSPYYTTLAGEAFGIYNVHVLGSLANTSAT